MSTTAEVREWMRFDAFTPPLMDAVYEEIDRQIAKWGAREYPPDRWFVIASEEWGEVAQALVERDAAAAQAEIVQTIACLVRLSAALEGNAGAS